MFQKGNRYFADWRDRKGVRHRKSFTAAEAATLYEEAARPKTPGKRQGRSGQPSRPESQSKKSSRGRTKAGQPSDSPDSVAVSGQRKSTPKQSACSTIKSRPPKATSRAATGRTRSSVYFGRSERPKQEH